MLSFDKEDYDSFSGIYRYSSVNVIQSSLSNLISVSKPTIIIGLENAKKYFPDIDKENVGDMKVSDNLYWCYSLKEDKEKAITDSKKLIDELNNGIVPNKFLTYDFLLDGEFTEFINKVININETTFLYFYKKACYLYNNRNSLCINLESLKFGGIDFKRVITDFVNNHDVLVLNYENIAPYIYEEDINPILTFENIIWTKYAFEINELDFNSIFPEISEKDGLKRIMPFLMSYILNVDLSEEEKTSSLKQFRKDIITYWLSRREIFFDANFNNEKITLTKFNNLQFKRLKYSNKRTITGRINCTDKQFNPQSLAKESADRKHIVSRYKNGKIVVIDYVSFETKIALLLSEDKEFIEKYRNSDIHAETAKVIFRRDTLNNGEREIGKSINHVLLYGGGTEKLMNILKDVSDNESAIERVKDFLSPIIEKIDGINIMYDTLGFVINNFGTIVRSKKAWASFNNYISSTATDIVIEKLFEVRDFVKNRNIDFIFQNHDSFIFDLCAEEVKNINELTGMISMFKGVSLQVDCKIGNNLFECTNHFKSTSKKTPAE